MQSRSGESAKMAAGRLFVPATGGSFDATRGGGHEVTGEKAAEQFSGTIIAQSQQYHVCQLQGIFFLECRNKYLIIKLNYLDIRQ